MEHSLIYIISFVTKNSTNLKELNAHSLLSDQNGIQLGISNRKITGKSQTI